MPFIGIVSDEKLENRIRDEILRQLPFQESSVLFIKEKSIENIKNIKFETVVLTREFKKVETLKKILQNTNYLIVNSDLENNLSVLDNLKLTVITYGFNSKATITASSIGEEEIFLSIQRNLFDNNGNKIELQEIQVPKIENVNCSMAIACVMLLYGKNKRE